MTFQSLYADTQNELMATDTDSGVAKYFRKLNEAYAMYNCGFLTYNEAVKRVLK